MARMKPTRDVPCLGLVRIHITLNTLYQLHILRPCQIVCRLLHGHDNGERRSTTHQEGQAQSCGNRKGVKLRWHTMPLSSRVELLTKADLVVYCPLQRVAYSQEECKNLVRSDGSLLIIVID